MKIRRLDTNAFECLKTLCSSLQSTASSKTNVDNSKGNRVCLVAC